MWELVYKIKNPRRNKNMAKLFMCNTSNVFEMKFGRPQTVLNDAERPNGVIVTLGDTKEATARELDHCHAITDGALESVEGAFIVVAPEINAQQYRTVDGQIGKFVLEAGETYSAYELKKLDRIEYSEAYFKDASGLAVGDKVKVIAKDTNGERFEKDNSAGCLRVVTATELWLPVMLQANTATAQGSGSTAKLMPASVKMYKLEVVK